ncbi:MAG: hypothetical protein Q9170_004145 [Blastenia crenularia]
MAIFVKTLGPVDKSVDPMVSTTRVLYWSMLECGLALVACCLPTLRPLFNDMSIEQLQRSISRILSSHSRGSAQVRSDDYRKYNTSNTSHTPLASVDNKGLEYHAGVTPDLEAPPELHLPEEVLGQDSIELSDRRTIRDGYEKNEVRRSLWPKI